MSLFTQSDLAFLAEQRQRQTLFGNVQSRNSYRKAVEAGAEQYLTDLPHIFGRATSLEVALGGIAYTPGAFDLSQTTELQIDHDGPVICRDVRLGEDTVFDGVHLTFFAENILDTEDSRKLRDYLLACGTSGFSVSTSAKHFERHTEMRWGAEVTVVTKASLTHIALLYPGIEPFCETTRVYFGI